MTRSALFSLPAELLILAVSDLDIRSLLAFSATCHHAHAIVSASFRTLSFSVNRTDLASRMTPISQHCLLPTITSTALSAFAPTSTPKPASATITAGAKPTQNPSLAVIPSKQSQKMLPSSSPPTITEPSVFSKEKTISVSLPHETAYDGEIITSLAQALTSSILTRYSLCLRNLSISLWTFDRRTALALSKLNQLRILSLVVEPPLLRITRKFPTTYMSSSGIVEEKRAWDVLERNGSWKGLTALRLDNARITSAQLKSLLEGRREDAAMKKRRGRPHALRELWLSDCHMLDGRVWSWLAERQHAVRRDLEILSMDGCGGEIDVETCEAITKLEQLKFLSIANVGGLSNECIEHWNDETWKIPQLELPCRFMGLDDNDTFIEVDPAYM